MGTRITVSPIGSYDDGRTVYAYRLEDEKGQYATLMNIGCTLLELCVRDKAGELRDVVLGMPSFEDYHRARSVMGATLGRCANRIAGGEFTLNGKVYSLDRNERGVNHLHGGKTGFQMQYWDGEVREDEVVFRYVSPDGQEGYPGTLQMEQVVSFRDSRLELAIRGETDKDTLFNPTNHSFFNLNGQGSGTILGHRLLIQAERYSRVDDALIPTEDVPVEGTAFDFGAFHTIGERIDSDCRQIRACGGYDVNYVLSGKAPAAVAIGERSGIRMEVETDSPCIQLFTGMGMGNPMLCHGKKNAIYQNYGGFCLEPQARPDAVHAGLESQVLLKAGQTGSWKMVLAFSAEE